MSAGIQITVRNEHGEVMEYRTGDCVLHIDVPEGRYVITVASTGFEPGLHDGAVCGTLQ
jgi:hypothetical protein